MRPTPPPRSPTPPSKSILAPNLTTSTNTDNSGLFSFPVNGNAFTVDISAPGYLPFAGTLAANSNPSQAPALYLTPTSTIDLTETASNAAITNGVVTVTSNGVSVAIGFTDGSGQAAISNLAAGTYGLQETAYGFQVINTTLTIGEGGATTSSSTMATLGGIVGQVNDGNGNPISNMDITIYGTEATNQSIASIETDAPQSTPPWGCCPALTASRLEMTAAWTRGKRKSLPPSKRRSISPWRVP